MPLLAGLNVVQIGPGLAAAVCGRLLADVGARVGCIGADRASPLAQHLNRDKPDVGREALATAALIVAEGHPSALRASGTDADSLRAGNPGAAVVLIAPFGQDGPRAEDPACDLTLAYASGIARLLTGQVDDLSEPPIRPVGEQSAMIGGVAAACAGMHAVLRRGGGVIDVSLQEALATLAMTELARAGGAGKDWSRRRLGDGNGATVCILPARDGYVAVSPREDHQWSAWLQVMGVPDWGGDPRFARKPDRVANWDALHALMSDWSRHRGKQAIADAAQQAHVPSFPLRTLDEVLGSAQLRERGFLRDAVVSGRAVRVPGSPFGIVECPPAIGAVGEEFPPASRGWPAFAGHDTESAGGADTESSGGTELAHGTSGAQGGLHAAGMPLAGVRVLDFSWVIAGPTTTRYLAAMGAEVIKVEAPGRGDPGRASELHTVLGQGKRGIVLDLKRPEGRQIARDLAARCDVLVENFATGVMDRLGLGVEALRAVNPGLIYLSASGLGRSGPEAHAVAYGTLLQCYAGFAGLNRHADRDPRVGFAWLDPMCGLMLAFSVAAALWQRRRHGGAARIDFSMIEAMLWTLADPVLTSQLEGPPQPLGDGSRQHAPHGAWRCAGDDAWVALAVETDAAWRQLCDLVPGLHDLASLPVAERLRQREAIDAALRPWLAAQSAPEAAERLRAAGIAAAALETSRTLLADPHLRARGFWERQPAGELPALPWRASFGRVSGPAPGLGADTDTVLRDVLGLEAEAIATLRQAGALG